MAKLKALLLTEGYHGMISQVEGLARALNTEFHHKIVRLNWVWNYIPPNFTPKSESVLKDKNYIKYAKMKSNNLKTIYKIDKWARNVSLGLITRSK